MHSAWCVCSHRGDRQQSGALRAGLPHNAALSALTDSVGLQDLTLGAAGQTQKDNR